MKKQFFETKGNYFVYNEVVGTTITDVGRRILNAAQHEIINNNTQSKPKQKQSTTMKTLTLSHRMITNPLIAEKVLKVAEIIQQHTSSTITCVKNDFTVVFEGKQCKLMVTTNYTGTTTPSASAYSTTFRSSNLELLQYLDGVLGGTNEIK